ncbi:MAG: DHHW family protein [Oscillospiraceae bacterium]|nr:DHHW family protein [Oscillospiraceae bacterium]
MKKKQHIISTILFLIIIFVFPVTLLVSKKTEFSDIENRKLQKAPSFSFDSWFSKSFMTNTESYIADHFPGRTGWVKTKIKTQLMLGKTELNGIYITDKRLIEHIEEPDYTNADISVAAINDFAEKTGVPAYVVIAPTSGGIYADTLGKNAPQYSQKEIINHIYAQAGQKVSVIDIYDLLYATRDDYIYYRTDHHWTSLGAYYAYNYVIQKLGFTPIAYSKYNIEHASSDFLGTYYSKTLYTDIQADTIDIYTYNDGKSVTSCTVSTGNQEKTYDDIYFRENLQKKDKYTTYLGPNVPVINIRTNLESDKKILIFKDSYANSFVPFLTQHYSQITVADMRYIQNYRDYFDPSDFSQILFLYNATTFCDDDNIKKLTY